MDHGHAADVQPGEIVTLPDVEWADYFIPAPGQEDKPSGEETPTWQRDAELAGWLHSLPEDEAEAHVSRAYQVAGGFDGASAELLKLEARIKWAEARQAEADARIIAAAAKGLASWRST